MKDEQSLRLEGDSTRYPIQEQDELMHGVRMPIDAA